MPKTHHKDSHMPETETYVDCLLDNQIRVAGFEPANNGIKTHCLTTWRYPNVFSVPQQKYVRTD